MSPCDHRSRVVGSPDTGEWLALELLGPDELMVNYELYVPEQKAMPRAVVRYFLGFQDSATLRLEYEMPIRAGKLARLDFTVGNAGKRPLTFQRIGLTKEYHAGRRPDGSLDVPEEIAGKDLAGASWSRGRACRSPST